MDSTRSLHRTALALGGFLLVLNVAGASVWRDQAWGAHLYGFLPGPAGLTALAILVLAGLQLARGGAVVPPAWQERAHALGRRRFFLPALALALMAVLWTHRIGHDLLGDALPLTHDLPTGIDTHPRQPLAMWLQQQVYRMLGPWFEGASREPSQVAALAVAAGSVLCGALFLGVAWRLGAWITGRDGESSPGWFTALLFAQGSSLLFFGYLENYTFYLLAVAIFLLAGVGYLQGRLALIVAGATLAGTLGLHLSSFVLWPGYLFLLGVGLRDRGRRLAALRDLGGTILAIAVLAFALGRIDPGFDLGQAFTDLLRLGRGAQGLGYLLSGTHLRDFSQEQLLVGPLSLLFFAPAAWGWVRQRGWTDPASTFLMLTAVTCLGATFVADEPLLGYARDWDLFVPALLPVLVATVAWWTRSAGASGRPLLGFLLVLSLLSLAPWVMVNRSESRSLQRMTQLPLGLGREAVVVGNWHLRQGDLDVAQTWFERALREHPGNNNALNLLGNVLLQRGEVDRALQLYEQAIRLRPRKIEYRDKITRILVEQRRYEASYPHFEALLREIPGDGSAWLRYAQALREGGHPDRAEPAYRRAAQALKAELERQPRSFPLNVDLGTVYASLGLPAQAEPYLRRAVELDPRSATALYQLAGVLVETSRPAQARPLLQRLLQLEPDHPQRQAIEQWLASTPR